MAPESSQVGRSAGAMLRDYRQSHGLSVDELAAQLKVPARKLHALEGDRLDELGGPTFARALAQSACRVMRCDPKPVLAAMPAPDGRGLDGVGGSLNTPFREHTMRDDHGLPAWLPRWVAVAAGVLVVAALASYLVPASWFATDSAPSVPSAAPALGPVDAPASEPAASVPSPVVPFGPASTPQVPATMPPPSRQP